MEHEIVKAAIDQLTPYLREPYQTGKASFSHRYMANVAADILEAVKNLSKPPMFEKRNYKTDYDIGHLDGRGSAAAKLREAILKSVRNRRTEQEVDGGA